MKKHIIKCLSAAIIAAGMASTGCHKTEYVYTGQKDYTTWRFIEEVSRDYYYWESKIPGKLDYQLYETPQRFFDEAIRYPDDHFSTITDSYQEMIDYFDNDIVTDGINMELFAADANSVIAVVNYVYSNTPAANSGLRRGCVITGVNGRQLTMENYSELLNLNACRYTYSQSVMENGEVTYGDNEQTTPIIIKEKCKIDPVLMVRSGEINGRRYGYLVYDAFTESTAEITAAIAELSKNNPTDLILDLRLNGGGYVSTLDTLASMLVPDGNAGRTFIKTEYNALLDAIFREEEGPDYNRETFVEISPKLQLENIYVLISGNSASASEELISGLSPYINIVKIGETSYGKYTTNILINNDIDGHDDNGIPYSSWAEYVTIGVCTNSLGQMDFKDGFEPDYTVIDPICCELGSDSEPLLQKALQLIGGTLAKGVPANGQKYGRHLGSHCKPLPAKAAMVIKKS